MLQSLQLQQEHMAQQTELIRKIISALNVQQKPRSEIVKPDIFDGCLSSPDVWIDVFQYATKKLLRNHRKWSHQKAASLPEWNCQNVVWLASGAPHEGSWSYSKNKVLTSFPLKGCGEVGRRYFFKFRTVSSLECFYEKRRLLQDAEPWLPSPATSALIAHGRPRCMRKQDQVRSPKSFETLLQCLQDMTNSGESQKAASEQWKQGAK